MTKCTELSEQKASSPEGGCKCETALEFVRGKKHLPRITRLKQPSAGFAFWFHYLSSNPCQILGTGVRSIINSSFEFLQSRSPFLVVSIHPSVKSGPVSVQFSSSEQCACFSPDKVWVLSSSDWQAGIHHASVSHMIRENVSLILQNVIYLAPSWPCTGTNHSSMLSWDQSVSHNGKCLDFR